MEWHGRPLLIMPLTRRALLPVCAPLALQGNSAWKLDLLTLPQNVQRLRFGDGHDERRVA